MWRGQVSEMGNRAMVPWDPICIGRMQAPRVPDGGPFITISFPLVQILPSINNDTDVATARLQAKRGRFMDVVTEDTKLVGMREDNGGR